MEPIQPKHPQSPPEALATLSARWQGMNARALVPAVQREAVDLLITKFTDFFLSYSQEGGILDATRRHIEATCGQERQLEKVVWGAAILGLREALVILGGERSLNKTRQYLEKTVLAPLDELYADAFTRAEHDTSIKRKELSEPIVDAYEKASRSIHARWEENSHNAPQLLTAIHARWKELVGARVPDSITSFFEHTMVSSERILAARSSLERSHMLSALRNDVAAAHDLIDELLGKKGPGGS